MGQIIIDMTQDTIFDRNIYDNLQLKIIPVMTKVKNIRPIIFFKDKNLYKIHFNKASKLNYL